MRNLLLPTAILLLLSCQNPYSADYYRQFFLQPYEKTETAVVECHKIVTWDQRNAAAGERLIGVLEKNRTRVGGTRSEYEFYFIRDDTYNIVGKATDRGEIYRYNAEGGMDYVGAYPIMGVGLKIFFKLPMTNAIRLDVPADR